MKYIETESVELKGNVLVALDEKYLDNVLNDIAKDIEEAGHEMHIIQIFDSHYISERRKLFVVWS